MSNELFNLIKKSGAIIVHVPGVWESAYCPTVLSKQFRDVPFPVEGLAVPKAVMFRASSGRGRCGVPTMFRAPSSAVPPPRRRQPTGWSIPSVGNDRST